ncbi:MAG: glycosyltransferase family 2 protein [Candidatus Hydrogenedentes bacterium]|nr:glycosyltransferase family 2 protein [Candidatus Hydrogenedentota bacterium]
MSWEAPAVIVVIPAYNEEESIRGVLEKLKAITPDYDVVVVDDGSWDRTAQVVAAIPGIRLLCLPFNLGIGGAMQTGFKYALREGYGIAVQCDADGQHPVEQIPALVARINDGSADVIIGSRYVADSDYQPSVLRRVGKSLLSRWIDFLIGGGVTDTTSGFRALNRNALAVFAQNYPEDYPEPEALVILHRNGLRCAEIPVQMSPRQGGSTSIRPQGALYYMVKVALAVLIDMFRKYAPPGDRG